MSELAKTYDPQSTEQKWYDFWLERGYFHADESREGPRFSVVIPPPNVTGMLHLGHVLNNTLQDVLVRFERMEGKVALWMPGTDHAGIATQNVVEKQLAREGLDRHRLGREKFVERVWEWKEQYGGTILRQLQRLGCSCDWDRTRFTMDEGLSKAVREVFVRLYEKGLIYRGHRIIHWCVRCHTALSDEEAVTSEGGEAGSLWHIRYPGADGGPGLVVATTRPETMLGDTGVAVNPDDERYRDLLGKNVVLPLLERPIPVVPDELVDKDFGTGAVKVTPAHDANDFEMGQRHSLPSICIMTIEGKINEEGGPYAGLDRFEARKRIVADLEERGLLVKTEPYRVPVRRCHRCDTVIEPYLSTQWFVKMEPLARPALEAVRSGRLRLIPDRWTGVYTHWLENIRDWCISRQLWWGHRIPVWYCDDCGAVLVSRTDPTSCEKCGAPRLTQDPDVLDTWFSSWLWPFSTMGWPEETPALRRFYPTDTLVTAADIIFFWVARMVMAGYEFMGDCPFRDVYLNSIVRDDQGRKMSKSLGNSPDPLDVIDKYGADALRFTVVSLAPVGQDVRFSADKTEFGRNFANKIWNATRFALMNLGGEPVEPWGDERPADLPLPDRWILSRLQAAIDDARAALEAYRLSDAATALYRFVWGELCDWYVELIKPALYGDDEAAKEQDAAHAGDGARPGHAPPAPVHALRHGGDLAGPADAAPDRVDHDRAVSAIERRAARRGGRGGDRPADRGGDGAAQHPLRARHRADDDALRARRGGRQRRGGAAPGGVHQGPGAGRRGRGAGRRGAALRRAVGGRRRPRRAVRAVARHGRRRDGAGEAGARPGQGGEGAEGGGVEAGAQRLRREGAGGHRRKGAPEGERPARPARDAGAASGDAARDLALI